MNNNNVAEQSFLRRSLTITAHPSKNGQHLDTDYESSTESSEDPSSSEFEMESSTADISKKTPKFPSRRQEISILGKNNQVFERCKIKVFQGAEKEDRSRETLGELSTSGRKRRRSPSPQRRRLSETRFGVSALETNSIADLCNNLDNKSESVKNETFELFELLRVCKVRLMETEDENKKLKRENELLTQQNSELRDVVRSSEMLKDTVVMTEGENELLGRQNVGLRKYKHKQKIPKFLTICQFIQKRQNTNSGRVAEDPNLRTEHFNNFMSIFDL